MSEALEPRRAPRDNSALERQRGRGGDRGQAAFFLGRKPESQAAPMVMAPDSTGVAGRQTVMLSPAEAHRIGVTYAPVIMGPVVREVRTVGQVSYDEQTVMTIAPKLDGWVDSLFVNYTGQTVKRGEPLLTIYAPMAVAAEEELVLARHLRDRVAQGTPPRRAAPTTCSPGRGADWRNGHSGGRHRRHRIHRHRAQDAHAPVAGHRCGGAEVGGGRAAHHGRPGAVPDRRPAQRLGAGRGVRARSPRGWLGQRVQATFEALPGTVLTDASPSSTR